MSMFLLSYLNDYLFFRDKFEVTPESVAYLAGKE